MKKLSVFLALAVAGTVYADPFEKAEVTRTVNKVTLIQGQKGSKPAAVGDVVTGDKAVKTGDDSRAELKFPDNTITRLGSNALFRFRTDTRDMTLDGGTLLFSCPKKEGGGQVQAGAVTAAVTGTDFIISYIVGGEVRVVVLEGKVWVYLTKFPAIRRLVRSGQLVVVPAGSDKIPEVMTIDLKQLMKTSRLLESGGFGPLLSEALINRVADSQQGRIRKLPDGTPLGQQAAQQARTAGGPSKPPKPGVTPPPAPPRPVSTPPPAPPKPHPSVGPSPGR
ncbi:hypothetical protein BH09VER1_BH09VER1_02190 [soil metagenome]